MARIIETGIRGKIDRMIRRDLREVLCKHLNEDLEKVVWEYADKFFPNGEYDYIFNEEAKTAEKMFLLLKRK